MKWNTSTKFARGGITLLSNGDGALKFIYLIDINGIFSYQTGLSKNINLTESYLVLWPIHNVLWVNNFIYRKYWTK